MEKPVKDCLFYKRHLSVCGLKRAPCLGKCKSYKDPLSDLFYKTEEK